MATKWKHTQPAKGGAKHMVQHCATDFYVPPAVPSGSRRGPQFEAAGDSREEAEQLTLAPAQMILTPPAVGRRA